MRKPSIIALVSLGLVLGVCGISAAKSHGSQAAARAATPISFYGVEMKRDDHITFKDFKNYARSHGQANYVVSKSPWIDYEGTGDVILASYGPDIAAANNAVGSIPGGGKVLEIHVKPAIISPNKGVAVYKLPLLPTNDSMMGDVWLLTGNTPQEIEKGVILSSSVPNISGLLKLVGFTDNEGALVYCKDDCTRYDLVTGAKTPQAAINGVEAAGIHRSVEGLLSKGDVDACKGKMTADFIQNADKNGYYRGFCKAKAPTPILEVRLKRDSGRWKVVDSVWQK